MKTDDALQDAIGYAHKHPFAVAAAAYILGTGQNADPRSVEVLIEMLSKEMGEIKETQDGN